MKDIYKVYVRTPSEHPEEEIFRNEDLWESQYVLDAMRPTRRILDTND